MRRREGLWVRASTSDVLGAVARLARSGERPSLSELAAGVHRSPWSFHRLFRDVTGEPPARFARRVALDRAAIRLISDDVAVVDVAIEAGFDSHEGFTRAFTRRFGLSPSRYRAQGRFHPLDGAGWPEHRRIMEATSPCLHLYRLDQDAKDADVAATVAVQDIEGFSALVIKRRITRDAVAQTLGECLPKVFEHAQREGLRLASPPFARYSEVSLGGFVIECGFAIAAPPEAAPVDEIERIDVAPGRAATAIHRGTYETLPATYAAIEQWMQDQGMTAGGAAWEYYVTDPGEHPDPADWETEVVQPVAD